MSTSTTKNTNVTKTNTASVSDAEGANGIQKIVEENTPSFVSNSFNVVVENLESFRINHFNNQYVFYPILAIFVFFVGRFLWRKFF